MMFEGVIDFKDIVVKVCDMGFLVVVICDCNGFYGVMLFSEVVVKKGVQLIIVMMLCVVCFDWLQGVLFVYDWFVFYVQDMMGYENLCVLVLVVYLGWFVEEQVYVEFEKFVCYVDGLIVLMVGGEGVLVKLLVDCQYVVADVYVDWLIELFFDWFYIEVL